MAPRRRPVCDGSRARESGMALIRICTAVDIHAQERRSGGDSAADATGREKGAGRPAKPRRRRARHEAARTVSPPAPCLGFRGPPHNPRHGNPTRKPTRKADSVFPAGARARPFPQPPSRVPAPQVDPGPEQPPHLRAGTDALRFNGVFVPSRFLVFSLSWTRATAPRLRADLDSDALHFNGFVIIAFSFLYCLGPDQPPRVRAVPASRPAGLRRGRAPGRRGPRGGRRPPLRLLCAQGPRRPIDIVIIVIRVIIVLLVLEYYGCFHLYDHYIIVIMVWVVPEG